MTAIAGTVALKQHGLTTQHPTGSTLVVATLGQVVHLAIAAGINQGNIITVPTACADIAGQEPLAVGTPLKPDVAIAVRVVVLTIQHGALLLGLQIDDAQFGTVLEVSHLLAIGTVLWLQRSLVGLCQSLLYQVSGIGKEFLVLILQFGLINLPYATALSTIHQTAPVGTEIHAALLLWGVGNLFGGLILNRCHKDVATHDEGHLLALGRETDFGDTARTQLTNQVLVLTVAGDGHLHLLWLSALAQGVDLTVLTVAECTLIAHREIAHGVLLVVRELLLACTVDITAIHVEGTVFLAGIVIRVGIRPAWCAVLALKVGQTGIVAVVHQPDVATDRTLVMLAEGVFVALVVVIQEATVLGKADILHGQC